MIFLFFLEKKEKKHRIIGKKPCETEKSLNLHEKALLIKWFSVKPTTAERLKAAKCIFNSGNG